MANYINPFTDIGFKRIFGQELSKPLLIDFLNNLLIGEKRIVNLKFLDKELPPVFVDDRSHSYSGGKQRGEPTSDAVRLGSPYSCQLN